MDLEVFKDAVKGEGWVIRRKGGYICFKRRDVTKPNNQGAVYSCHTKDEQEAIKIIKQWLVSGFPQTAEERKNDVTFAEYLLSFWREDSLYFKNAVYEGRHVTKQYIARNLLYAEKYVVEYFKDIRLSEINEKILNDYFDWLIERGCLRTNKPLARGSIVAIKSCILPPLKWGRRKGIIKQVIDFLMICPNISRKPIYKRGILSAEETLTLLNHKWHNIKAYIAFCIAVNCGLRVGEIRALKIGSFRKGFIIVSHSFNDFDGLKCTKTGNARVVPCPDIVLLLIAEYIQTLPEEERGSDCYILTYDKDASMPLQVNFCKDNFYAEMLRCGIKRSRINELTGEEETICFHSLRHQTATRWVESGLDLRLIASAMGHSVKMLEHYSDHLGIADMESLRNGLLETHTFGAGSENKNSIY